MKPLLISVAVATAVAAQEPTSSWPQFLGAHGAATAQGASTLEIGPKQNVKYRVALPAGRSSPTLLDGRIYMTGHDGDQLVMFALKAADGRELWRHAVPGPKHQEFMHKDAGIAMPSACANAERVFFYFPSYGLIARTIDGELAWEKRLPEPESSFGIGSSPILHDGHVILLRDGCDDASLYALDEKTGEEAWVTPRLAFHDSHATPFIWNNRERTELVIASTGSVIGYDPGNGKELWRVEGLTPLVCTTPTADRDHLYFAGWSTPSATGPNRLLAGMETPIELTDEERADPKKLFARLDANGDGKIQELEIPAGRTRTVFEMFDRNQDQGIEMREWLPLLQMPVRGKNLLISIKPGGSGNVTDSHVEWSVRRGIPYVSSPLLYEDRIYMIKASGILSCVDAKTGKDRFRRHRLDDGTEYYATPVGVDGHVILCANGGTVYVLEVADEVKIVHEAFFDEPIFATPAVVDGVVYLRTEAALYAFAR